MAGFNLRIYKTDNLLNIYRIFFISSLQVLSNKTSLIAYSTLSYICFIHGGAVVGTVALQQDGSGFEPAGAFLCGVCILSQCLSGFPPSPPASSHSPKTVRLF